MTFKQSNEEVCRTAQHNLDKSMPHDEDFEDYEETECVLTGDPCTGCKQCLKFKGKIL